MNNKNDKNDKNNKLTYIGIILGTILGIILFLMSQAFMMQKSDKNSFYLKALDISETITFNEFVELRDSGKVDRIYYCQTNDRMVVALSSEYSIKAKEEGLPYTYSYEDCVVTYYPANEGFRLEMLEKGIDLVWIVFEDTSANTIFLLIANSLPVIIMVLVLVYWVSTMSEIGKMKHDDVLQKSDVTFDDIIGLDETKEELDLIVKLIKKTVDGVDIGARVPHGILLSGPPGVGKTMIAKALSNAAGIPFINVAGSDFQELYVGSGPKKVRELFKIAKQKAPCIIFIDEFDAIGTKRSSHAANSEDVKTIDALLKELDGFKSLEKVFILAATNHPEKLDKAVIRSGRFDREICIQPPKGWEDRVALFKHYLKDKKVSDDVNLENLSRMLTGYTGADIATVCNEAALVALSKGLVYIDNECLETAIDKKIFKGSYAKKQANENDRKIVAYHEAGHAVASVLLGDKVTRASIRNTTSGVGGAVFGSDLDSQFITKSHIENRIKIAYAGRAAEEIFFKDITTGASSDIMQATDYLAKYVTTIGFDENHGLVNWQAIDSQVSDDKKVRIEELSKKFYKETVELIEAHKDMVDRLASELLMKELMTGDEVVALFEESKVLTEVEQKIANVVSEDVDGGELDV